MSTKFHQRKREKNKWIDIYYDEDDEDDNDAEEQRLYEQWEVKNYIEAQWDEIYQAINENNADLLYGLLPPVNIRDSRQKYWSSDLHDYAHYRGHGILCRAVELEHADCVEVILGKIRSEDLPRNIIDHCSDWQTVRTPLIIACEKRNLNIIQKLIDCDPTNNRVPTAFFNVLERGDEVVMNYLVSRCNLRMNQYRNQTALDWAIRRGYMETAKLLIQYGETIRNRDGFSPMMLAAHHDLDPLIDLLFQRLPIQEAVDELMLLACHYIITDDAPNRQKAFDLFVRGLNEEESEETGVPHEVYEYRRECKTVEQLLAIWDDNNALRMHALIVSERILLRLSEIDPLMKLIDRQCNVYRNSRLWHRSVQLRTYARHLIMRHTFYFNSVLDWKGYFFDELIRDLDGAWNNFGAVPIELIDIVSACIFGEEKDYCLSHIFDLLATISHMMEATKTTSDERRLLFTFAQRAIRYDTMENSLLVHCLISDVRYDSSHPHSFYTGVSILPIIRLMIQCGANVNGKESNQSAVRPLHVIATWRNIVIARPIIELLLAYDAHADCINDRGYFPQDLALAPATKELLCITRKLSLKCRCAQIIVSKKINYRNYLSPNLLTFVRLHTNTETN